LTLPKISRSDGGFTCSAGSYQFIRSTGAVEVSNITGQVFHLIANGEIVESIASLTANWLFTDITSFEGKTLYCQVQIKQEDVDEKYSSLDKLKISENDAAQTETLRIVNESFYKERDSAYASRTQGRTNTSAWKKALEVASAKRLVAIGKAKIDYLKALENSGISILQETKVVAPKPEPAVENPTDPAIKVPNIQPTVEMQRIGSVYFASGTYFINDASKRTLKALAEKIKTGEPKVVLSYGHTDQKGGVDNVLLSKNRSIAIAKYLKSLIPNQKIVTGWFAATKLVAKGKSTTDLAKNRRVEIYIK
jgi:outer membrane protein OmpA-like peptidoglycan-associated protein